MENVLLTIHLILALLLIGVVLLQRSEGGGLGMGSGGGNGVVSNRGVATALTKLTWIFAIAFIITSISLTIYATRGQSGNSVIDRVDTSAPAQAPAESLLPPALDGAPIAPPAIDAPTNAPATGSGSTN